MQVIANGNIEKDVIASEVIAVHLVCNIYKIYVSQSQSIGEIQLTYEV